MLKCLNVDIRRVRLCGKLKTMVWYSSHKARLVFTTGGSFSEAKSTLAISKFAIIPQKKQVVRIRRLRLTVAVEIVRFKF